MIPCGCKPHNCFHAKYPLQPRQRECKMGTITDDQILELGRQTHNLSEALRVLSEALIMLNRRITELELRLMRMEGGK